MNRISNLIVWTCSPIFARERRIRAERRAATLASIERVTRTAPGFYGAPAPARENMVWQAREARQAAIYAARKRGDIWA